MIPRDTGLRPVREPLNLRELEFSACEHTTHGPEARVTLE